MSFWDRLIYGKSGKVKQPNIRFGRYTDSYKTPVNYAAWDKALIAFEEEHFLESFRFFLTYLRDEQEDNVHFWKKDEGIEFELFQGSKKINGFANEKKVKIQARIAETDDLNVGFMRRLIEKNFSMEYARFGLDEENNIVVLFDTSSLDGSPYKLYYAIKEVAINADKQDDLLLEEFGMLKAIDIAHLEEISQTEKEVKYNFIASRLAAVLREVETGKLGFEQYPGAYVYLMLDLVYKLDYLTRPEGYLMEELERAHREYFAKDDKKTLEKTQNLARALQTLLERPKEAYFKEMYRGRSTFGITVPVNHDRVVDSIDNEIVNMDWYAQNGHESIALSIPGFIVGYCLFNYAVPKPVRELFELYYQIMEQEFFQDLGFQIDYYEANQQKFQARNIRRAIKRICNDNQAFFPKLNPNLGGLRFSSQLAFAKSYLLMIRNMDVIKINH
jgi:hypothetical protein